MFEYVLSHFGHSQRCHNIRLSLESNQIKFETAATQVSHVTQIRGAKVPIVKFMHVPSGLSCDVSFKNLMSVMNTSFIELSQVGGKLNKRTES